MHRSGASGELAALAEELGVPVLTTAEGKGAIPDDHALAVGSHKGIPRGGDMDSDPLQQFLNGLDTLLVVGSSLALSRTKARGWSLPENLIHVDVDRTAIGKVYDASLSVEGDAKAVLGAIQSAVQGKSAQLEAGFDREVANLKQAIQAHKQETMPNQLKVMEAISSVTARDAIFTGDVNVATHSAANYLLPVYEPRSYLLPHWGGLGFALPAGAGAKAAFPQRQVVCITGDGGFQFNMQELGTCVQYGLNQVVMVFNDSAWGVLKQRQTTDYKGRYIGSELQNPNFARLAESYGANGVQVDNVADMTSALEDALKSDVLTVIEVQTPNGFANLS